MKIEREPNPKPPITAIVPKACTSKIVSCAGDSTLWITTDGEKPGRNICYMREIPELIEALKELHAQWEENRGN